MASKVKAPLIGAELDPSDPSGSAMNVVLGIVGVAVTLTIVVAGQTVFNKFADASDAIDKAVVV